MQVCWRSSNVLQCFIYPTVNDNLKHENRKVKSHRYQERHVTMAFSKTQCTALLKEVLLGKKIYCRVSSRESNFDDYSELQHCYLKDENNGSQFKQARVMRRHRENTEFSKGG